MTRRQERTSDPERLAQQLYADLSEIAEGARFVGKGDHERIRNALDGLFGQLKNTQSQVLEAMYALDEARKWNEVAEWDVVADADREQAREYPIGE